MDKRIVTEQLTGIFRDIFDRPTLQLRENMTASDVEGWDSLAQIDLVVAVEKTFKIKFTSAEVRGLSNVGDFISLIARKAP